MQTVKAVLWDNRYGVATMLIGAGLSIILGKLLGMLCIGVGVGLLIGTHLQGKKSTDDSEKKNIEERDKALISKAIAELKAIQATPDAAPGASAPPVELGMSIDDPRIYLAIKQTENSFFRKTPFELQNDGNDVAHSVQIQSFKLKRKAVEFAPVEVIRAHESKETLPTVNGDEKPNDILYWLLKDWDGNGELLDEWEIPLTVSYSDFSKQKRFIATMTLVFFPIRYLLDEKHNVALYKRERPHWEFRAIEFKRVA